MQENIEKRQIKEDEIDLINLIKTIWSKRKFIIIFTSFVVVLAFTYVSIQKPIYEAKAVIKIGEYRLADSDNKFIQMKLANVQSLSTELKILYIDLLKDDKNRIAKLIDISPVKNQQDFLSFTANAISNELAVKEIQNVINYVKIKHKHILNEIIERKKLELKSLDQEIDIVKNAKLVSIQDKIKYQEHYVLNSIESKVQLNRLNLSKSEKQLIAIENNLKKIKLLNSTLAAINIMEKRNLEEKISRIKLEYVLLNAEKENILQNVIPALKRDEQNIIQSELSILLEKRRLLSISMMDYKDSDVVGNIMTKKEPIKPKKLLIVIVAFMTGFILSILLLFFINFINNLKHEL